MIYITGKEETIDQLMKIDGYHGLSTDYKKKLLSLNPHLNDSADLICIEPYTPLCLLKSSSEEMQEIAGKLNDCILEIREHLWELQSENRLDENAIEAAFEIIDEYQDYQEKKFKKSFSSILIFLFFLLAFLAYALIM